MVADGMETGVEVASELSDVEVVLEPEPTGWLGIKEAAEEVGYQPQYVRQLVLKEKIPAVKLARDGYFKWYVDMTALNYWKNNRTRSGMRRYILRIDSEAEPKVRAALDALVDDDGNKIEYTLALAYVPKPKDEADADAAEAMAEDADAEVDVSGLESTEPGFFGE